MYNISHYFLVKLIFQNFEADLKMVTKTKKSESEMAKVSEIQDNTEESVNKESNSKPPKKGIIYLSTIPPYMNVTQIREYFGQFGIVCKVYLQLDEQKTKYGNKKAKRNPSQKFVEGWVEFERKHVAKKVARLLSNTKVSDRKKSKQYDYLWNIKYLKNFKWAHLHERLAYEKAARKQKLRAEIQLAKRKSTTFSANLDKNKKNKQVINREYENLALENNTSIVETEDSGNEMTAKNRKEFLSTLF